MAFLIKFILLLLHLLPTCVAQSTTPGIHLPLYRRGGRSSYHEAANLTNLAQILHNVEAKYARSYRTVEGNRLVRRWHESVTRDENDPEVIDVAGRDGQW